MSERLRSSRRRSDVRPDDRRSARRRHRPAVGRQPGDRLRLLLGAVLLFCALPWIAATLDLSLHMPAIVTG